MRVMTTLSTTLSALSIALCLSGCHAPALPKDTPLTVPTRFSATNDAATTAQLRPDWWVEFNDATLDGLVQQALKNNPSLAASADRLSAAMAQTATAHADRLPQLSLSPQASRRKASTATEKPWKVSSNGQESALNSSGLSLDTQPYATDWQVPLQLSWEVDLWGKLKASENAAQAQAEVSKEDLRSARLSLIASVAQAWIQLRADQASAQLISKQQAVQQALFENSQASQSAGITDLTAATQAQMALFDLNNQQRAMEQHISNDIHTLEVLCGMMPGRLAGLRNSHHWPLNLPDTPASLPASVLKQRPDVRRDTDQLNAARAQVKVARADFFPSLELTTSLGTESSSLSSLLSSGSLLWSLGARISQPLFDGGRLQANYHTATAQFEEAAHNYQATVIQALSDVDKGLTALQISKASSETATQLVAASARLTAQQQARFNAGMGTQDAVNQARMSEYQQQLALVTSQTAALQAWLTLRQSLGE